MPRKRMRRDPDDNLVFINITHPDQNHLVANQTRVRRQAMHDIGRSKRQHARESYLRSALLVRNGFEDVDSGAPSSSLVLHTLPTEIQLFSLFHDVTPREREILHFMHVEGEYTICVFRFIWLELALRDPAARNLTLANAALALARYRGLPVSHTVAEHPESIHYYSKSLEAVTKRLDLADQEISEGLIICILGFTCYDIATRNWHRWAVHIDGLVRILAIRGGFRGLSDKLMYMTIWKDLIGSAVWDSYPHFPFPEEMKDESYALTRREIPQEEGHLDFETAEVALRMLGKVSDKVNQPDHDDSFWVKDIETIQLLGPVSHYLLSMPRLDVDPHGQTPLSLFDLKISREIVRLACLVLVSQLKGSFHMDNDDKLFYLSRFAKIGREMRNIRELPTRVHQLELWSFVIITLALVHGANAQQIEESLEQIQRRVEYLGLSNLTEAFEIAKRIIWVDHIHDTSVRLIQTYIQTWRSGDGMGVDNGHSRRGAAYV